MSGSKLFNGLKLDEDRLMQNITAYFSDTLNQIGEEYASEIRKGIPLESAGAAFFSANFRQDMAENTKVIQPATLDKGKLTVKVGIDFEPESEEHARTMVVNKGHTDTPMFTKPGEDTWNKQMRGKSLSSAESEWALPGSFSYGGANFMESAEETMNAVFENMLVVAVKTMPMDIFTDALLSK